MKRVIGLMSGTSLDGVDAALMTTDGRDEIGVLTGGYRAYSDGERTVLQDAVDRALAWKFDGPRPDFSEAEAVLLRAHAELVEDVLGDAQLLPGDVDLIGFHGQTVVHVPPAKGERGQTLQIGDGQALAERLGVTVVHDFRSADMEAGGHGAPLATLYHQALVHQSGLDGRIAVLNLGGVANISWIEPGRDPVAFDTGPANGLIDAWCEQTIGKAYDEDGRLAASGAVNDRALAELLQHGFFKLAPPKSLDRWDFSLDPVQGLAAADGAATLLAFTVRTVTDAITSLGRPDRVLVTGGGRKNSYLMSLLANALDCRVEPVEAVGWDGDLIEAEAFAWLAVRAAEGLPTSLPSTTGASGPVCGGRVASPQ